MFNQPWYVYAGAILIVSGSVYVGKKWGESTERKKWTGKEDSK